MVLFMTPQLTSLTRDSREASDWRNVDGVRSVVDALNPGIQVTLTFGSGPGEDPIRLGGHTLSCSYGTGTVTLPSKWALFPTVLLPLHHYHLWLGEGEIQVTEVG
jgi:hypothetical protein